MADPIPAEPAALSRTGSSTKLNAEAPEFVPSPRSDPPRLVITPPPAPTTIPTTAATPTPTETAMINFSAGMVYPVAVRGPVVPMMPGYGFTHVQYQQPPQHVHQHQYQHRPQQQQQNYQRSHNQHQNQYQEKNNNNNNNQRKGSQFHGGGGEKEGVQNGKDNGNGLAKETCDKIVNQVEYYFSDVNLATTEHLIKFINKDPEGYVPISVVASFKKIKAAISTHSQLAAVLRSSKKLVVSDDGKKVKRLHPLTRSDMEELQARIILAENLPEDYSHQNLMKIFSAVGSVKSIRTCQPQVPNNVGYAASRSSKAENMLYSNKVHAFVEYESVELAEKAVAELNDEGNWRNGLRVRPLHKCSTKSVQARGDKAGNEVEGACEEDGTSISEQNQSDKHVEDSSRQSDIHSNENLGEDNGGEKEGGQKKGRGRGKGGRGRGRGQQHQANRAGAHAGAVLTSNQVNIESTIGVVKNHLPPGPRMPDGTRGFTMGRGKPLIVNTP